MDDRQFDELSKHLSTGLSRKGILKLLGGVGAAGVAAASAPFLTEAKKKGKKGKGKKKKKNKNGSSGPEKGLSTCDAYGETCHDANDCCDRSKGVVCQNPAGGNPQGPKTCNCPGLNDQGHKPDFNTDPKNCGKCGTTCKADETCSGGKCVKSGCQSDTQCGGGKVCCSGTCVEKSTLCGGKCGNVCKSDEKCCSGVCKPTASLCGGKCDNACKSDETCCSGVCKPTNSLCGGKCGNYCKQDELCCGDKCVEKKNLCGGTCANTCPDGERCCGGTCKAISGLCGDGCTTCGAGKKCCNGRCIANDRCCNDDNCPEQLCKIADCDDGDCKYVKVKNGDPGPKCTGTGEFCCNGDACCEAGEKCTGNGCCPLKTCEVDYAGKCGSFSDGCGGTITCSCPGGQGCCDKVCIEGNQCCSSDDCDDETCKIADCQNGNCNYTPVKDWDQGPNCTGGGEFCCGGKNCCTEPEVCTGEGTCCTPKTCKDVPAGTCGDEIPDGCGGTIKCGCGNGESCCADECVPTDDLCGGICGNVCEDNETCCVDECIVTDDLCGGICGNVCGKDQRCCVDTCIPAGGCCGDNCPEEICQTGTCNQGTCSYQDEPNNEPGTLCDAPDFCCNGDCCEAGDICFGEEGCCTPKTCEVDYAGQCGTFPQGCGLEDLTCACGPDEQCTPQGVCVVIPSCIPVSIDVACSGLNCGPASNGCGVDYDCGLCKKKKKKGQRPIQQTCVAGVCKPFKKKRCIGKGLAGQPCSGKCKCANGRKCSNGRCCEGVGDGSRHCNSNSECCSGLMCAYRRPGQHRVCMPRNAKGLFTESTESTATPGIAVGALLTGLAATLGARLTGNGEPASVAMDEVQIHALGSRD